MGYTIQYGPSGRAEAAWRAKHRKKAGVLLTVGLLAAVIALGVFSVGIDRVKNFLIPGDPEVTKAAFAQFTEDVRQGDKIGDAITAFCREIIDNAQIFQ